ncbi:MAG: hypothetical protein IJY55_03265 [Clostridia bacterium]|nr:hypothetical protein [Clostridia bacterium]
MTKNELFEILGEIDNTDVKQSNSFKWVKWASIAACLVLVATLSIPIINNTSSPEHIMYVGFPDTQNKELSQEVIHLPNQPYREGKIFADIPADVSGTPLADAVNPYNLSSEASAVFGGSYLDESGNFIVVLTEDTPENRSLICRELNRNETTVTFKSGKYTLLYLTELQSKISSGMVNNELKGVVSSAVMETDNNIRVSVQLDNEETIEKLHALDTTGNAIDIKEICICSYPRAEVLPAE